MKLFGRKNDDEAPVADDDLVLEEPATGPWDSADKSWDDDPAAIDLGSLVVRGRDGLDLQLPTDGEPTEDGPGDIGSVVLVTEDSAMELRPFASMRSGGLWDEVRTELAAEVERLNGDHEEKDGPYGRELHVRVPVELPDGETGFQPSRIFAVEGPRWMLRVTLLGDAALNPTDDGLLMDALQDVVVVRGTDARIPREPLLLRLPEGAVFVPEGEGETPTES